MYRFMLLPRVRMVQTCTNAYIERGYKSGNRTINGSWNILNSPPKYTGCGDSFPLYQLHSNGDGIWSFATCEAVQIWV
jgi:hypothetical protein